MNLLPSGPIDILRTLCRLALGIGRVVKLGPRTQHYPLGRFVVAYCGILTFVLMAFAVNPGSGLVAYFLAGYALNHFILSHLEWNNFEFSLGDIAKVKLLAIFAWPIMYPPFIVQLAITRYL